MKQREILVLYLINHNPQRYGIWRLILVFDRADFPSHIGKSLDILIANKFIYPTHFYNENFKQPIAYEASSAGKEYLRNYFNLKDLLDYIKTMHSPDHMLTLVQNISGNNENMH